MIASLPMYDRPETAEANDRLWHLICAALGDLAPDRLTRDIADLTTHWQSPDLVLSQTCGFPYRAILSDRVHLAASPVLNLDCPTGHYYSVIIAHKSRAGAPLTDFNFATAAYNEPMSQSGWAALYAHMSGAGLQLGALMQSGAHRASAQAVADRQADIAAIDALTWQMICKWDDFASDLCVIEKTAPTPALPYICARSVSPILIRDALRQASRALSEEDKDTLGLLGVTVLPTQAYLDIATPPPPAK